MNSGLFGVMPRPNNGRRLDYFINNNSTRSNKIPLPLKEGETIYFDFALRDGSGAAASTIEFRFDGDNTAGNYSVQVLAAASAVVSSAAVNAGRIGTMIPNGLSAGQGFFTMFQGHIVWVDTVIDIQPTVNVDLQVLGGTYRNVGFPVSGPAPKFFEIIATGSQFFAKGSRFSLILPSDA
jgi:hypothetical protein